MAELDFTALNQLAYKGFETAEEQEKKDALIEQGFTIVEDKENPFTAPQTASERRSASSASSPSRQDKRPEEPQRAPQTASGSTRYKKAFRTVYNFLEQAEATLERASADTLQLDKAWEEVAVKSADIMEQWEDAFITDMIIAVTDELYRRYYGG
jgi:hypothetical protein